MSRKFMLVAGAAAIAVSGSVMSAPAKKASASPPPVATYWMDVSTQAGLGAGMMGGGGGKPSLGDIMGMFSGRSAASYTHGLSLRLASRTPAPASPQADHLIPQGLQMGPSLPLIAPPPATPGKPDEYRPGPMDKPQGRMLVYWGCGDHVGAGQPLVIDFAQMMSGKVPENLRRMGAMMGRMHGSRSGPLSAPGFGEWPNARDTRAVPPTGSLIGAHRVLANYAPAIDFTLGPGQDFMGPLNLMDGGPAPSGADLLRWNPVGTATGYALAMFGAGGNGDMIMWSSARTSAFANLDYLSPAEAAREIAAGNVLVPNVTQCLLPAEVARAVPAGMVMGIGYGPEAHFADSPKAPKWTVTVRYKSGGSLMRGMSGMMGGGSGD